MQRQQLAGIAIGIVITLAGCTAAPASVPPPEEHAGLEPSTGSPTWSPTSIAAASPSATTATTTAAVDGSPSMDPIVALIRAAAETTIEAGTMRFGVEVRPSVPVEGVTTATGSGQVSFLDPIRFRYLAHAFTGLGGTSPEYEVIFDDPRILLRGREALVESPETWMAIDFDELGIGEIQRKRYLRLNAAVLLILVPAFGVLEAEVVGPETLRSEILDRVAATHYTAVATIDVPTENLPPSAREVNRDRLAGLSASEASRIFEVDFWIDAKGRIVRITSVREIESQAIEALITTYDMTSFGAPMNLSVPDGAEVLTLAQALERVRSSSSPSPSS